MPSVRTSGVAEINNQWLVVHDNERVFAPVSKNANTSIKQAIQSATEKKDFVPKDDIIRKYGNYEVVAVVRNPFDRLVSCFTFFQKVQPHYNRQYEFPTIDSFEEFVKAVHDWPDETSNKHFRSQFNLLSQDGYFLPDSLIDFRDVERIREFFPIKGLENKKKQDRLHYSSFYTPVTRKLVEERFRVDLDYFNYRFEENYAALQA